ncbi:TPA: hypothetical protein DCR49_00050 [Candidatus Delongbacteria bacterium]|nr:MAG: hypothetical protein A2Y39_02375 [Candidatus Delongbacteria bacterium GWF2_40_14]HAQ60389.1 hypothetical protein [Candidatus Delongbacteria bacterium]
MDLITLREFFLWGTVIGFGLMVFITLAWRAVPELVIKSQKIFFPVLNREQISLVMYGFLGIFKIMIIVFFAIPYLILLIIS